MCFAANARPTVDDVILNDHVMFMCILSSLNRLLLVLTHCLYRSFPLLLLFS